MSDKGICDVLVSEGNIVVLFIRCTYPVLKSCERFSERLNSGIILRERVPLIVGRPTFDQFLEACVPILQTGLDRPNEIGRLSIEGFSYELCKESKGVGLFLLL